MSLAVPWAAERIEVDADGFERGAFPGYFRPGGGVIDLELVPCGELCVSVVDEHRRAIERPSFVDVDGERPLLAQAERDNGRVCHRLAARVTAVVRIDAEGRASRALRVLEVGAEPVEVVLPPGSSAVVRTSSSSGRPLSARVAFHDRAEHGSGVHGLRRSVWTHADGEARSLGSSRAFRTRFAPSPMATERRTKSTSVPRPVTSRRWRSCSRSSRAITSVASSTRAETGSPGPW